MNEMKQDTITREIEIAKKKHGEHNICNIFYVYKIVFFYYYDNYYMNINCIFAIMVNEEEKRITRGEAG